MKVSRSLQGDARSRAAVTDDTGIDGFNLASVVVPECFEDFFDLVVPDLVVPELQLRGRYKTAYAEGSRRQKLWRRDDQLAADHPGAFYRRQTAGA